MFKRRGVRSIAINSIYLLGAHGVNSVARAVYAVALTRFLGPESYGIYSYGLSWSMTFLPVAMLGLDAVLSRDIGRSKDGAAQVVANSFTLRIAATLIATVVCLVTAQLLEHAVEAQQVLLVFSLALLGRSIATWTNSVFTAYEVSSKTFEQEGLFRLLEVPAGIVVLLAGGGMLGVACVHAAIWWLQAARGLVIMHRQLVPARLSWTPHVAALLVRHGVPLCLANIFGSWVLYGPLVVFRHLDDSTVALGHLALALQVFLLLTGVPLGLGRASLPVLSRAVHREDNKDQLFISITFRATIVFGSAVAIGSMGFGPWLVATVFGASYADAGALLAPALWLLIPLTFAATLDNVLVARGRMLASATSAFAGALFMTVSVAPLVARFEALGIVYATGLGLIAWAVTGTAFTMRDVDLDLGRSVLRPACAAALAVAAFHAVASLDLWLATVASLTTLLAATFALRTLLPAEQAALMTMIRSWLPARRQ